MRRQSRGKQSSLFDLEIHPEVKLGIFAILLFLVGALGLLAFFDRAGQAGRLLDSALAVVFGAPRLIFPIILIALGALLLRPDWRPRLRQYLGITLLLLSVNGLIHITTFEYMEGLRGASIGEGGGYLGLALSYPLDRGLGFIGGTLVLVALILVSLLLISKTIVLKSLETPHYLVALLIQLGWKLTVRIKNRQALKSFRDSAGFQSKEINETETTTEINETSGESASSSQESASQELIETPKIRKKKTSITLPLDLLTSKSTKPSAGDIKTSQLIIQKTLENFGIEVEMGEVSVGPTVSQYTLRPAEGVKLARITALSNDLALALAAHPIRIEAPIPGKSLVGIEVPNQVVARVPLREILESDDWKKSTSPLTIALGKDVAGRAWSADLGRMPHLLVAGATGSGKTVALNSIIISLLYRNQPETMRLILVDPKRVELPIYNGIPHLLTPVITDIPKTVNAFRWLIGEMERRFDLLAKTGKRDIESYNKTISNPRPDSRPDTLPYIVLVVDELADLMVAAGSEIEASIIRLAQMARAVGVHLVLATQRPSVDIITGLIKANITSRLAFAVASQIDSRTILDTSGAEKLMGRGDMLFVSAELGKPRRLQGSLVTDEEITHITEYLKKDAEEIEYNDAVTSKQTVSVSGVNFDNGDDPLFGEARDAITRAGKASASLLQRRLKIGYARAARLLDIMEEQGFIGPADGAKPREVLITPMDHVSINDDNPLTR